MSIQNEASTLEGILSSNLFLTSLFLVSLVSINLLRKKKEETKEKNWEGSQSSGEETDISTDSDRTSFKFLSKVAEETNCVYLKSRLQDPSWNLNSEVFKQVFQLLPKTSLSEAEVRRELRETVLESTEIKLLTFLYNPISLAVNFRELLDSSELIEVIKENRNFKRYSKETRFQALKKYSETTNTSEEEQIRLAAEIGVLSSYADQFDYLGKADPESQLCFYRTCLELRPVAEESESLQSCFKSRKYAKCIQICTKKLKGNSAINKAEFHILFCCSLFERDELLMKYLFLLGRKNFGKQVFYFVELIYSNFPALIPEANCMLTVYGSAADYSRLLSLLCSNGKMLEAVRVYDQISKRNYAVDSEILGSLMDLFVEKGKDAQALAIYRDFRQNRLTVDNYRLNKLVKLCLDKQKYRQAVSVVESYSHLTSTVENCLGKLLNAVNIAKEDRIQLVHRVLASLPAEFRFRSNALSVKFDEVLTSRRFSLIHKLI